MIERRIEGKPCRGRKRISRLDYCKKRPADYEESSTANERLEKIGMAMNLPMAAHNRGRRLYYAMLCYAMLSYTKLYYTMLYYTMLYYTMLYYTVLYCTILYCTILSYAVLYTAQYLLYYTTPYHTILTML